MPFSVRAYASCGLESIEKAEAVEEVEEGDAARRSQTYRFPTHTFMTFREGKRSMKRASQRACDRAILFTTLPRTFQLAACSFHGIAHTGTKSRTDPFA